jgi:hypothetical protein
MRRLAAVGGDMWALREFRFDEGIEADAVFLFDEQATNGQLVQISRDEAIALARARGQRLIAWWPQGSDDAPSCIIGAVSVPLSWEELPDSDEIHDDLDERLWFEGSCGGRDLLVGNSHTFRGRMAAWCPQRGRGYSVSLSEMGEMSDETRYFIRGFLSGNEPGPPYDDAHGTDSADARAWRSAIRRFRSTGSWYGRWSTCKICGCVLLPDSSVDHCHVHRAET